MPAQLLTLEQVADRLQVSLSTVRRLIRDNELTGIRVRGDWRVDPADLQEYIQKSKSKPKDGK